MIRILILAVGMVMIHGGCNDENGSPSTPPATEFWKLGGFTYARESSTQTKIAGSPDLYVVSAAAIQNGAQGSASGSSLILKFYDFGEGDYQVVDNDTFVAEGSASPSLMIDCTIGTAVTTGSTAYAPSAAAGTATVEIDDGQFFVTIKTPVTLAKTQEFSGGVDGVEEEYQFSGNRIN